MNNISKLINYIALFASGWMIGQGVSMQDALVVAVGCACLIANMVLYKWVRI